MFNKQEKNSNSSSNEKSNVVEDKMKRSFKFLDKRPEQENQLIMAISQITIIEGSVQSGLIKDDDLAMIPEAMGKLVELSGKLRDDLYRYHERINKELQFPIIRNQFSYAFAKGVESAYLWSISKGGYFEFNYDSEDSLNASAGAQVNEAFATEISIGIDIVQDVFVDFQGALIDEKYGFFKDGRVLADAIAAGYFWASQVGVDYGMNLLGYN